VETVEVANEEEMMSEYDRFMVDGYEGAIVRDKNGLYLSDPVKSSTMIRSRHVLKLKPRHDAEWPVINFSHGDQGIAKHEIMWIIDLGGGKTMPVQLNTTSKERQRLLIEAKKDFSQFEGRLLKVAYDDLSEKGVPLRAKGIGFRDE
jgi:hypothetical protein